MSLIVHYKMNGDATDSSGGGNHGTPVNMAYAAGKIGQAGSFGALAKINCPAALIPTSDWSVSFWAKPTIDGTARYPCGQSDGATGMLVRINATTGLLRIFIGGAYRNTRNLVSGVWSFVGITYDAGKNLRTFVDADQYYVAGIGADVGAPAYTAVGAYGAGVNGIFLGMIDSFRIDSPALTVNQMLSIRNNGAGTEAGEPYLLGPRGRKELLCI